jgi:NAD(P)-dependent dehydrogenase (short-subunit alcohol dehydrogenase family)
LASEGADIVAFDICEKLEHSLAPGATEADLAETASRVESYDRRCLAVKADARDLLALQGLADSATKAFGRVDCLVVNHGLWTVAENSWELEEAMWDETIDHMLTGAWKVCKAFIPAMLATGRGGAIVIISSVNGIVPLPGSIAYCVAKAGEIQMMRVLARELGKSNIRVNVVAPGGVATPMTQEGGTAEKALEYHPDYVFERSALPGGMLAPQSISDAVVWLLSDQAAFVTGAVIPVDAGWGTF